MYRSDERLMCNIIQVCEIRGVEGQRLIEEIRYTVHGLFRSRRSFSKENEIFDEIRRIQHSG